MPKRRAPEQLAAAVAAGEPPPYATDEQAWHDAQDDWVLKHPTGVAEKLPARGDKRRRSEWQRITKQHAALMKAAAATAPSAVPSVPPPPPPPPPPAAAPAQQPVPIAMGPWHHDALDPSLDPAMSLPSMIKPRVLEAEQAAEWWRCLRRLGLNAGHFHSTLAEDDALNCQGRDRRHSV